MYVIESFLIMKGYFSVIGTNRMEGKKNSSSFGRNIPPRTCFMIYN
jgi:hypothetical protein